MFHGKSLLVALFFLGGTIPAHGGSAADQLSRAHKRYKGHNLTVGVRVREGSGAEHRGKLYARDDKQFHWELGQSGLHGRTLVVGSDGNVHVRIEPLSKTIVQQRARPPLGAVLIPFFRGDVIRDYYVKQLRARSRNVVRIRLTPLQWKRHFRKIEVVLDRRSSRIVRVVIISHKAPPTTVHFSGNESFTKIPDKKLYAARIFGTRIVTADTLDALRKVGWKVIMR